MFSLGWKLRWESRGARGANKGQWSIQYNHSHGSRPPARKPTNSATARNTSSNHLRNNQSYLQLGSSSNRYSPRLPQQETKLSTKQLAPTDPLLGPENLRKTGFIQKGLPSSARIQQDLIRTTSRVRSRILFFLVGANRLSPDHHFEAYLRTGGESNRHR